MGENESRVMDVADVVAWEQEIAASGTSLAELMRRAGGAVASYANDLLFEGDPLQLFNGEPIVTSVVDARKAAKKIVVLCGSGNNGGDGWVAAQLLGAQGFEVVLITKVSATELTAEPARTNALLANEAGGFTVLVDPDRAQLAETMKSADLIIDAILGTGFSHDTVRAPYDEWIRLANAAREDDAHEGSSAKILAVDCPSGLNAQTGEPAEPCITADLTVTMLAIKTGLTRSSAAPYLGTLRLASLGIDKS